MVIVPYESTFFIVFFFFIYFVVIAFILFYELLPYKVMLLYLYFFFFCFNCFCLNRHSFSVIFISLNLNCMFLLKNYYFACGIFYFVFVLVIVVVIIITIVNLFIFSCTSLLSFLCVLLRMGFLQYKYCCCCYCLKHWLLSYQSTWNKKIEKKESSTVNIPRIPYTLKMSFLSLSLSSLCSLLFEWNLFCWLIVIVSVLVLVLPSQGHWIWL